MPQPKRPAAPHESAPAAVVFVSSVDGREYSAPALQLQRSVLRRAATGAAKAVLDLPEVDRQRVGDWASRVIWGGAHG